MSNAFREMAKRMFATGSPERKIVNRGLVLKKTGQVRLDERQSVNGSNKRGGYVKTYHAQLVDRSKYSPQGKRT